MDKYKVWVLDDGHEDKCRELVYSYGFGYIYRPNNQHAKGGNLNYALYKSGKLKAKYLAILDCDMLSVPDFLNILLVNLLN